MRRRSKTGFHDLRYIISVNSLKEYMNNDLQKGMGSVSIHLNFGGHHPVNRGQSKNDLRLLKETRVNILSWIVPPTPYHLGPLSMTSYIKHGRRTMVHLSL